MSDSAPAYGGAIEKDPTGRFIRFAEKLGEGAFKEVYRGVDTERGIDVAWNQMKLDRSSVDLQKVCREVQMLQQLSHPNIIQFFHSWVDPQKGRLIFITEMMTSGNLRQFSKSLKLNKKLRVIKAWSRQILEGLKYLHSRDPPIIHRDLKCENIFINGNVGQLKIGDLGLATVKRGKTAMSVIGTPEYMAPEYYDENYTEKVDIWAFGLCVLEMVTNEYPYSECDTVAQVFRKVYAGKLPASLDRITDPEVRGFIEICLAPASNRLTAAELLEHPFLQNIDKRGNLAVDKLLKPPTGPPRLPAALRRSDEFEIPIDDASAADNVRFSSASIDENDFGDASDMDDFIAKPRPQRSAPSSSSSSSGSSASSSSSSLSSSSSSITSDMAANGDTAESERKHTRRKHRAGKHAAESSDDHADRRNVVRRHHSRRKRQPNADESALSPTRERIRSPAASPSPTRRGRDEPASDQSGDSSDEARRSAKEERRRKRREKKLRKRRRKEEKQRRKEERRERERAEREAAKEAREDPAGAAVPSEPATAVASPRRGSEPALGAVSAMTTSTRLSSSLAVPPVDTRPSSMTDSSIEEELVDDYDAVVAATELAVEVPAQLPTTQAVPPPTVVQLPQVATSSGKKRPQDIILTGSRLEEKVVNLLITLSFGKEEKPQNVQFDFHYGVDVAGDIAADLVEEVHLDAAYKEFIARLIHDKVVEIVSFAPIAAKPTHVTTGVPSSEPAPVVSLRRNTSHEALAKAPEPAALPPPPAAAAVAVTAIPPLRHPQPEPLLPLAMLGAGSANAPLGNFRTHSAPASPDNSPRQFLMRSGSLQLATGEVSPADVQPMAKQPIGADPLQSMAYAPGISPTPPPANGSPPVPITAPQRRLSASTSTLPRPESPSATPGSSVSPLVSVSMVTPLSSTPKYPAANNGGAMVYAAVPMGGVPRTAVPPLIRGNSLEELRQHMRLLSEQQAREKDELLKRQAAERAELEDRHQRQLAELQEWMKMAMQQQQQQQQTQSNYVPAPTNQPPTVTPPTSASLLTAALAAKASGTAVSNKELIDQLSMKSIAGFEMEKPSNNSNNSNNGANTNNSNNNHNTNTNSSTLNAIGSSYLQVPLNSSTGSAHMSTSAALFSGVVLPPSSTHQGLVAAPLTTGLPPAGAVTGTGAMATQGLLSLYGTSPMMLGIPSSNGTLPAAGVPMGLPTNSLPAMSALPHDIIPPAVFGTSPTVSAVTPYIPPPPSR